MGGNHSVEICQFVDPLNFASCFPSCSPSSSWVRGHHPRSWDLLPVGSVFCSEPVLWHLLKGLHQAGISGDSQLWAAAALRGFGPADFHQISPEGQPRGGGPGLFRGVRTPQCQDQTLIISIGISIVRVLTQNNEHQDYPWKYVRLC